LAHVSLSRHNVYVNGPGKQNADWEHYPVHKIGKLVWNVEKYQNKAQCSQKKIKALQSLVFLNDVSQIEQKICE
jgi:hypothetical protein